MSKSRVNKRRISRCTFGMAVAFAVLSGCGESDLKEIQTNAIAEAQRGAVNQPVPGAATDNPVNSEDVVDEQTPEPGPGPASPVVSEPGSPLVTDSEVNTIISDSQIIFSDEFNGGSVDPGKWKTSLQWGPEIIVNDEDQYYVDVQGNPDLGVDPFVFNGESVAITAQLTSADLLASAKNQPYLSGVLTTHEKFDFTYGYAEIRAKLPTGKGYWPGFWMLSTDFVDLKPQLYVMEGKGDVNNRVYHRYNYSGANNEFVLSDLLTSSVNEVDSEFHTYGVEWSPGSIKYFVDGVSQHTIAHSNVSSQKMYLILNLAVGGWFPEAPNDSTVFPGSFMIDYVRVYQRNQ